MATDRATPLRRRGTLLALVGAGSLVMTSMLGATRASATTGDTPAPLIVAADTTIDTNTGIVTPGGAVIGRPVAGVAGSPDQWDFDVRTLTVTAGTTLRFVGSRVPLVRSTGDVDLAGVISVSATGVQPGPGGGAGGLNDGFNGGHAGFGGAGYAGGGGGAYTDTAGGGSATQDGQAGSGPLGGAGGDAAFCGGRPGRGGTTPAYAGPCSIGGGETIGGGGGGGGGFLDAASGAIYTGSGGGGGAGALWYARGGGQGGGGGGAVVIYSATAITVDGAILADGAAGTFGVSSGGDGGGGTIWLRAPYVGLTGRVSARGSFGNSPGATGTIQVNATCESYGNQGQPISNYNLAGDGSPREGFIVSDAAYAVDENATLTVDGAGVLSGDCGPDLSAQLTGDASHGNVAMATGGSFVYTPTPGFAGTDSFSYQASSGSTPIGTATVTITVRPVGPVLHADVRQPINADGSSVFKANRGVIPVKFTLTADGTAACDLPTATITVSRIAGATPGAVDEGLYTNPADSGTTFRTSDCQYTYNLALKSLGPGSYTIDIHIDGHTVGVAEIALR